MSRMDEEYAEMLQELLVNGRDRVDRTGTGTLSVFGYQYRINIKEQGFPILTTKAIKFENVFQELMWFLSGSTNIKPLNDKGVHIWNAWADGSGELGPIYGKQFTDWNGVNQFETLVDGLLRRPYSRRHILSAWNVSDLPDETESPQQNVKTGKMALAPCHVLYQFYCRPELDGNIYVDCMMTQRSADVFLGLPYNICSVGLLLYVLSMMTGYAVGSIIHSIGDLHLYKNHIEQAKEQLTRSPRKAPTLILTAEEGKDGDPILDWQLVGYDPHPAIYAKVSI